MDRIEPRIHDEIKDYKEKFYNFTLRQWIFGILILLTTVPLYLFISPKIGSDLAGWIVIIVAIPIAFFGFIPIQGLNAEKIIFYWIRNYINFAKPIVYITDEELLQRKQKKKKNPTDKKEIKKLKREEKVKRKELKKERKKQRELALAKKKYASKNIVNNNFSLSEEEAKLLLRIANQVVGKESNVEEEQEAKKE